VLGWCRSDRLSRVKDKQQSLVDKRRQLNAVSWRLCWVYKSRRAETMQTLQQTFQKLEQVLGERLPGTDGEIAMQAFIETLTSQLGKTHLDPLNVLEYLRRRVVLWDDFQASLVLQPVLKNSNDALGLLIVWTKWGNSRPALPGGIVNGPDDKRCPSGYLATSKEQAALELAQEAGIEVNQAELLLLSVIDIRLMEANAKLINNHQLSFFLAPAISIDDQQAALNNVATTAKWQQEIQSVDVVWSFAEFTQAVREWELAQHKAYPYDRVLNAVQLFFEHDVFSVGGRAEFGALMTRFNDSENAKSVELLNLG
jgi:hypothetical protein